MALNIGDKAPEFELPDAVGQFIRRRDFAEKNVVLAFYVFANTPG